MKIHLAIDLGAESGRVIAVWIDGDHVGLHEIHRFMHEPVTLPSGLHWSITHIWQEIVRGLTAAATWAKDAQHDVVSVGVDTWGVDWCLLDERDELIGLPHAYRDPRNPAFYEKVLERFSADRLYQTTGIQLMAINSLYSLYAHSQQSPNQWNAAKRFLFMPDLLHFWLCGNAVVERTIASTSQMLDIHSGQWSQQLLEPLGLFTSALGAIVPAGSVLGNLRSAVCDICGLNTSVKVIAPGSHDTASAVASVPATAQEPWAFLSSGTWSLLGTELSAPCVNQRAQDVMFTNEAGVDNTIRFLKNIAGLWLVQECRRAWARQVQAWTYADLTAQAVLAPASGEVLDTNFPEFQQPGNMPEKIERYAAEHGIRVPRSPGETVRLCLDSLASAYRNTLDKLEQTLGQRMERLYIVGGGAQNQLLNQLAEQYCQRPVITGPYEATAIGNGLVQAIACGELANLSELRQLVAKSLNQTPRS